MIAYYRFTLIDYTFNSLGDEYVIDEPAGFDGFSISLARDADWHGVFTDYSVEGLEIDGIGYDVLTTAYNEAGIEANVVLRIEYSCEGCEDDNCWQEAYQANVDFGRSVRRCGDVCEWAVVLQPDSCINTLRARYDVAVDMDSLTAMDGVTALEDYPYLGIETEIPSKTIRLYAEAESEETNTVDISGSADWTIASGATGTIQGAFLPIIPIVTKNDISVFTPETTSIFQAPTAYPGSPISELLLITDNTGLGCFTGVYDYEIRLKGTWSDLTNASRIVSVASALRHGVNSDGSSTTLVASTSIDNYNTSSDRTTAFDFTMSGQMSLTDGEYVWLYVFVTYNKTSTGIVDISCTFDEESYIHITTDSLCDPTPAKIYLAHETLSRITESVTDNCLKVRSNYFGRTDSSPYAFTTDGCGSLEALTNGLLLRRAVMQDGTTPKFTISLKDTFEGLKAIHAVGMGLEIDPLTDAEYLTVEPIRDFYTDDIILTLENSNAETRINEQQHFAKITIGYNKWEAEEYNGLDEFLTKREYRSNLTKTNGEAVLLSDLIASGYAIEVTRRKGASSEDWRFDNDTFIICLKRNDTYAQLFDVEQGNISNAANIIDPATILNYRLSPVRNLLRWLWYIIGSYMKPNDPDSVLIFSKGDGNVVAEGINTTDCIVESEILAENAQVDLNSLAEYLPPLWYNETVTVNAPLSFTEFNEIRDNKYGLIGYICNDTTAYGWLQSLEYSLKDGEATFTLIPKRDA